MNPDYRPHVLSEEEINLYLQGDRREVDRLILYSLNRLAAAHEIQTRECAVHKKRDEDWQEDVERLGGIDKINERAEFVNELIEQSKARRRMMEKVASSTTTWALIAFLGFLVAATWEHIVRAVRTKLGG